MLDPKITSKSIFILSCKLASSVIGNPLPLSADAHVSIFCAHLPPLPGTIINLSLIITGPKFPNMKIKNAKMIIWSQQTPNPVWQYTNSYFSSANKKNLCGRPHFASQPPSSPYPPSSTVRNFRSIFLTLIWVLVIRMIRNSNNFNCWFFFWKKKLEHLEFWLLCRIGTNSLGS